MPTTAIVISFPFLKGLFKVNNNEKGKFFLNSKIVNIKHSIEYMYNQ